MIVLKKVFLIRKNIIFLIIYSHFIILTTLNAAPPAEKVMMPDSIHGAITIDSEMLINLSQKFSNLTVIDSRITEDRTMGHIEDSLSLPDINTNCESLKKHIKSQITPTVFYCNGPKCGRSVNATRKAVQCGYTKLFWFRGGFTEWQEKDYPYLNE